jgi:hypothetical protein
MHYIPERLSNNQILSLSYPDDMENTELNFHKFLVHFVAGFARASRC